MDKLSEEISSGAGVTTILIISLLLLIIGIGIIVLVLLYQKKQLQYLKDKEQLKGSFKKVILESKLEIQEQTMKNISQEIHDNVGQVLSLVKLNINTMDCTQPLALQEKINNSGVLIGKAIQDLRDLSRSLHTDTITQLGLVKSIEYELDMIKRAGNYEATLVQNGSYYHLSPQHELILFRIFQEALNNIMKHSRATSVEVLISHSPATFAMRITDNGEGFLIPGIKNRLNEKQGLGIKNMENRSHIIGADYTIVSEPGKGTTITVILPITYNR